MDIQVHEKDLPYAGIPLRCPSCTREIIEYAPICSQDVYQQPQQFKGHDMPVRSV